MVQSRLASVKAAHQFDLPPRQAVVLVLAAAGLTYAEIATELGISDRTAENHLYMARQRVLPTGVPTSTAVAVTWAHNHKTCCLATPWNQLEADLKPPSDA